MTTDGDADIETLGSCLVYENRWMRVREDAIRRRNGSEGIYGVVEKPDFVVVVPVEDDGRVHLVEQYRYPVRGRYWEVPQGTWEHTPGADPLKVARGELREETGLEAAGMAYVGRLFQGYGYATQGYHVFLATGLQRNATADRTMATIRAKSSHIVLALRVGWVSWTARITVGFLVPAQHGREEA